MAFDLQANGLPIGPWIYGSINSIVSELIMTTRFAAAAIAVIIVESKIAIDSDRLDLAYWLTCMFRALVETADIYKDLDSLRMLAMGIEILAEAYQSKKISIYTARTFLATIKALETVAKKRSVGSYVGPMGGAWPTERTIADILKRARHVTTQAARSSIRPTKGQWPTSR
jgi:hypothetical protein